MTSAATADVEKLDVVDVDDDVVAPAASAAPQAAAPPQVTVVGDDPGADPAASAASPKRGSRRRVASIVVINEDNLDEHADSTAAHETGQRKDAAAAGTGDDGDEEDEEDEEDSGEAPAEEGLAAAAVALRTSAVSLPRTITPSSDLILEFEKEPLDPIDDWGVLCLPPPRSAYADFLVAAPSVVIVLSLIIPVTLMILAVSSASAFQTGTAEFRAIYHPVVRADLAWKAAREEWSTVQQTGRNTDVERSFPKYRLYIQFTAQNGLWYPGNPNPTNLISENQLRYIQDVETLIFETRNYRQLCWTNDMKFGVQQVDAPPCVPPSSATTYFFPGKLQASPYGYVEFELNGRGSQYQMPATRVLNTVLQNDRHKWFFDAGFSNATKSTSAVRSQVTLGYPLYSNGTLVPLDIYNIIVDEFIVDLVLRLGDASGAGIDVTVGGDRIIEALLAYALQKQLFISISAIGVAFLLMLLHIKNLVLTFCAIAQMVLSYVTSYYVVTRISTSAKALSIVTAVTMIVTLAFDSHSIIIVHETFLQSGRLLGSGRRNNWMLEQRIAFLLNFGVSGVLLSHVVAAAAVGCTLISPVPALRQFGVTMLVNIATNIFMCLTFLPALIVFHSWYFNPAARTLLKQRQATEEDETPLTFTRHSTLRKYLRSEAATKALYEEASTADMLDAVAGGVGAPLFTSPNAVNRDPMLRRMSMSQSARFAKEAVPSKTTFLSPRMVPLPCIFQISPQLTVPILGKVTVRSAVASYNRRLIAEGGDSSGGLAPAFLKGGRIQNELPEAEIAKHRTKWEYIGRFLGTVRPDDFSPYVTEQLANTVQGETLYWRDVRAAAVEDLVEPAPVKQTLLHKFRLNNTFHIRYRTREVRDGERLNVRVRHAGLSLPESLLQVEFVSFLQRARIPLFIIGVLATLVMIPIAVQFRPMTRDPLLVDVSTAVSDYEGKKAMFPIDGPCDYCSAYQQPVTKLPQIGLIALQECYAQGFGLQMHAYLDRCNVCFGNDSCLDCANRPWGVSAVDNCGLCVVYLPGSTEPDRCTSCATSWDSPNASCSYCNQNGFTNTYGASCSARRCDTTVCPPANGRCNFYTGDCECHNDFVRGFFANDPVAASGSPPLYCSVCAASFTPASGANACTIECAAGDPCGCDTATGKCTLCTRNQMGSTCSVRNASSCFLGSLAADGSCTCPYANLDINCHAHASCSYHGRLYTLAESPVAGCGCFGQWQGASCQYCRCLHGGVCDDVTGECLCVGAWAGTDCSICADSCQIGGLCPDEWIPENYDVAYCVPIFCSASDVASGIVCPACAAAGTIPPKPSLQVQCKYCIGDWNGTACEFCKGAPYGLTCATDDGVVIGCDSMKTPIGQTYKIVDKCGVCRGLSLCLGCDGVIGSSDVPDRCGVCSGHDECLHNEIVTVNVNFVWGLISEIDFTNGTFGVSTLDPNFDITDTTFQVFLLDTCRSLMSTPEVINANKSDCAWEHFVQWATSNATAALLPPGYITMNLTFPFVTNNATAWNLHYMLFRFANETNRFSDLGFVDGTWNVNNTLVWLRARLNSFAPVDAHYDTMLTYFAAFDVIHRALMANESNRGNILHASAEWSLAISRMSAIRIVKYTMGIGVLIFATGIMFITLQPLLVFFGVWCMSVSIAASLMIGYFLNWELGPIEQITFCLAVAFSSQYTVHVLIEYAHGLKSSRPGAILSHALLRKEVLRTALMNIAASILTSAAVAVVASITVLFSIVRLFTRVGIILMITQAMAVFFSVFFLPAAMLTFGPSVWNEYFHGRLLFIVSAFLGLLLVIFSIVLAGEFPTLDDGFLRV